MIRWAFVVSAVAFAPATPEKKTVSPAARARVPQVRTTTQASDGSPQPRVKKAIARPAKKLAAKAARKPIRVKKPSKNKPRVAFVPCSASLPDQAPQPTAAPKIAAGMDGLVAERAWLWPNGATLNVHFLDGTPEARKAVAEVALEWTKHANLKFAFFEPSDPPATTHVRVTFEDHNCNSALGTSSQYAIEAGDASMRLCHLDTLVGTTDFEQVVIHEFGHAIGMHHEHQSPKAKFDWDKPFVYKYYRDTVGWNEWYVDEWVFRQIQPEIVDASDYDPDSVMQYAFPPEFTKSGKAFGGSHELSKLDKEFVAKTYPGVKKTEPKPKPQADKTKFFERALAMRNDTGETIDVRFVWQTKKGDKWVWLPGADASTGPTLRLTAGEERSLPDSPKGRRLRFLASSLDGKRTWSAHAKASVVTAPNGGYLERQIQTFVAVVEGAPDAPALDREALYAAASAAYDKGDRKLARGLFAEFAKRFPEDEWVPWALLNVAISWIEEGNYRQGLVTSYALVEKHPDADASGYAWFYGGVASLNLGNCDDARAWFDYVADPAWGLPADWQQAAREYLKSMTDKPKAWCG